MVQEVPVVQGEGVEVVVLNLWELLGQWEWEEAPGKTLVEALELG